MPALFPNAHLSTPPPGAASRSPRSALGAYSITLGSLSPPVSPKGGIEQCQSCPQQYQDAVEYPPSPKTKLGTVITEPLADNATNETCLASPFASSDHRTDPQAHSDGRLDNAAHDAPDARERPESHSRESRTETGLVRLESPPCPASPPLDPSDIGAARAAFAAMGVTLGTGAGAAAVGAGALGTVGGAVPGAGIHRNTRPPTLALGGSMHGSNEQVDRDALRDSLITPLTLPPHDSRQHLPRPTAVPPPTPTSARTFGLPSPNGPAFEPLFHTEAYYARRGSTGTFGGRNRGSIIIIPSSTEAALCAPETPVDTPPLTYHSPTLEILGRTPPGTHEKPESPAAIMQYLLDARERNELSILPSEPTSAASVTSSSSSFGDVVNANLDSNEELHSKYWNNRHTGMFDLDQEQVEMVTHLRERSLSEAERVLEDLCEHDRPAKLSTEIAPNTSPDPNGVYMQSIHRPTSIDSVSTGYADSAMVGLLPGAKDKGKGRSVGLQSPTSSEVHLSPQRLPASKADLPAEQKAVLVKRTRKLEKVLGTPLPEETVERFVVEPTISSTVIANKVEEAPWPSPESRMEFLREDCVPQRASAASRFAQAYMASTMSLSSTTRSAIPATTRSRLARAFLGDPAPTPPTGLQVYVSRECLVAETRAPEVKERHRGNLHPLHALLPSALEESPESSPDLGRFAGLTTPHSTPSTHTPTHAHRKLAKLLLGKSAPPLHSPSTSDEHLPDPRAALPHLTRTLSNSSVTTERKDRWPRRFRRRERGDSPRRGVSPAPSATGSGASGADDLSSEALTADQRRLARRRATKLGQLLGDTPPTSLLIPADATPGSPIFESYKQSLNSLIFMVQHDHERLALMVDDLGDKVTEPITPSTPASSTYSRSSRRASAPPASLPFTPPPEHPLLSTPPAPPAEQYQARKNRMSKLTHFFGEGPESRSEHSRGHSRGDSSGSDWSPRTVSTHLPIVHNGEEPPKFHVLSPPPPPRRPRRAEFSGSSTHTSVAHSTYTDTPPSSRRPSSIAVIPRRPSETGKGRQEMLDQVLWEMCDDVVAAVGKGAVSPTEAAALRDMMGVLRRKRESEAWSESGVQ